MNMYIDAAYPKWPVNEETLVFDTIVQRQVCAFEGRVILPVGATIELYDEDITAHGTAVVVGVRMLAGAGDVANQICLDVETEQRWWDRHPLPGI